MGAPQEQSPVDHEMQVRHGHLHQHLNRTLTQTPLLLEQMSNAGETVTYSADPDPSIGITTAVAQAPAFFARTVADGLLAPHEAYPYVWISAHILGDRLNRAIVCEVTEAEARILGQFNGANYFNIRQRIDEQVHKHNQLTQGNPDSLISDDRKEELKKERERIYFLFVSRMTALYTLQHTTADAFVYHNGSGDYLELPRPESSSLKLTQKRSHRPHPDAAPPLPVQIKKQGLKPDQVLTRPDTPEQGLFVLQPRQEHVPNTRLTRMKIPLKQRNLLNDPKEARGLRGADRWLVGVRFDEGTAQFDEARQHLVELLGRQIGLADAGTLLSQFTSDPEWQKQLEQHHLPLYGFCRLLSAIQQAQFESESSQLYELGWQYFQALQIPLQNGDVLNVAASFPHLFEFLREQFKLRGQTALPSFLASGDVTVEPAYSLLEYYESQERRETYIGIPKPYPKGERQLLGRATIPLSENHRHGFEEAQKIYERYMDGRLPLPDALIQIMCHSVGISDPNKFLNTDRSLLESPLYHTRLVFFHDLIVWIHAQQYEFTSPGLHDGFSFFQTHLGYLEQDRQPINHYDAFHQIFEDFNVILHEFHGRKPPFLF